MSDHAAESMKFKVTQMNKNGEASELRDFRIITLDKIFSWIDKKDYDDVVKDELKKMVSKYPQNAYVNFGKNFQKHLGTAQKNARKNRPLYTGELGDDNYKKIDSLDDEMAKPEKKGNIKNLPSVTSVSNDFDDMDPPTPKKVEKEIVNLETKEVADEVKLPSESVTPHGIHENDGDLV